MNKNAKKHELAIMKAQEEIETRYGPVYNNINNYLERASAHLNGLLRNMNDERYTKERIKYVKANLAMVDVELTNIERTLQEFMI